MLKPYHPENLLPALIGLVMAFFGGSFLITIAAVEALRGCGAYDGCIQSAKDLYKVLVVVVIVKKK